MSKLFSTKNLPLYICKISQNWLLVVILTVIIVQVGWVIFLDFPPNIEQMDLGLNSPVKLWLSRVFSLMALALATYIFSKLINDNIRKYYWFLIIISPLFPILWMSHPLESLKIALLSLVVYMFYRKRINLIVSLFISISILISINILLLHEKPSVFSTLSLPRSQVEVMERMRVEDTINPRVPVPQFVRRIAYNKYFISLKNTANQALYFFDGELLFFQEVSATETKAPVFFYWPEVFLFILSLWIFITKKGDILSTHVFLLIFFISLMGFILSGNLTYVRLSLMLWLISLIMTIGLDYFFSLRQKWGKVFIYLIISLVFYGVAVNQYDRYARPQFWLDNRPIVYKWLLGSAKKYNYQNYQKVYLTDVLGNAKDYCQYFLNNCHNFVFSNFDLSHNGTESSSLYLGFSGNFYGKVEYREPPRHIREELLSLGLRQLLQYQIRDNVANGYGKQLIVGESIR